MQHRVPPRGLVDRDPGRRVVRLGLHEELVHDRAQLKVRRLVRDREDHGQVVAAPRGHTQGDPVVQGRGRRGLADRGKVARLHALRLQIDGDGIEPHLHLGPPVAVAHVQLVPEPDTLVAREHLVHLYQLQLGVVLLAYAVRAHGARADRGVVPVVRSGREHVVYSQALVALVLPRVGDPPVHRHARERVPARGGADPLAREEDGHRLLERAEAQGLDGAVVRDLA